MYVGELRVMQLAVHNNAVDKGWWETADDKNVASKLALIHSEVSEALEDYRKDLNHIYFEGEKPCGFGVELADAVIRIMDLSEFMGIDLFHMMQLKHGYNLTRPHRHGGKRC